MRRTKEDAEQTRRAILDSAMNLFYEKGYSKTTFDEMAKRIGLTKGAVYWYYRNKPDIVAALINEFAVRYLESIETFLNQNQKYELSVITDIQLQNIKKVKEDEKFYKFLFFITCQMEWSETIINKIQPAIAETKKITKNIFFEILQSLQKAGKIKSDIDINLITEILLTTHAGLLEGYFTKRLTYEPEELIKTGCDLIFKYIKTEG